MHFSIALMSSSYSTVYWFSCFKINSDLTFSLQISALENFTRIPSQSLMLCPAANKIQVYFYRITWKVVISSICLSTHFYMILETIITTFSWSCRHLKNVVCLFVLSILQTLQLYLKRKKNRPHFGNARTRVIY